MYYIYGQSGPSLLIESVYYDLRYPDHELLSTFVQQVMSNQSHREALVSHQHCIQLPSHFKRIKDYVYMSHYSSSNSIFNPGPLSYACHILIVMYANTKSI